MDIFQQEIFGPVLSSTTFRTPEEALLSQIILDMDCH